MKRQIQNLSTAMHTMSCKAFLVAAAVLAPVAAWADETNPDFTKTGTKICGFFSNVNNILNMASIVVVTVAVVMSGYQIAFAHKRISDVAPILIGGVLIGAAAQIANMLIGNTGQTCGATPTSMIMSGLQAFYA